MQYDITQYTLHILSITGNQVFDYFFNIVMFFGLVGWFLQIPMKLINRS